MRLPEGFRADDIRPYTLPPDNLIQHSLRKHKRAVVAEEDDAVCRGGDALYNRAFEGVEDFAEEVALLERVAGFGIGAIYSGFGRVELEELTLRNNLGDTAAGDFLGRDAVFMGETEHRLNRNFGGGKVNLVCGVCVEGKRLRLPDLPVV